MAIKRIKTKDHENLSDLNVEKVISLLEDNKPITKKEACEILNISYNTTRLKTIIENYKSKKQIEKKMREGNRGKPASRDEIVSIIEEYLAGESVSTIAKNLFRSSTFVNSYIDKLGIPRKPTGEDKRNDQVLPDQCIADEFRPGQKVWSAVYHSPCVINKEVVNNEITDYETKYGCKCYSIYVLEPFENEDNIPTTITTGGFYAYSTAYNLGSLEHLIEYGAKINV